MRLADALQRLLSDIRQNIETYGADPTAAIASLNAPLRRGSRLVDDLRAYAGAQRLVASDTELLPLVRSLADALQRTLDQRIRVEADVDGTPDDAHSATADLAFQAVTPRDQCFVALTHLWTLLSPRQTRASRSQ